MNLPDFSEFSGRPFLFLLVTWHTSLPCVPHWQPTQTLWSWMVLLKWFQTCPWPHVTKRNATDHWVFESFYETISRDFAAMLNKPMVPYHAISIYNSYLKILSDVETQINGHHPGSITVCFQVTLVSWSDLGCPRPPRPWHGRGERYVNVIYI